MKSEYRSGAGFASGAIGAGAFASVLCESSGGIAGSFTSDFPDHDASW
jgi:hypothetical protein